MKKLLLFAFVLGLVLSSCQNRKKENTTSMENPFFKEWTTPFGVPPFDEIKEEHFVPAVKEGIQQQQAEIDSIVNNTAAPDFNNTILAFDKSGALVD